MHSIAIIGTGYVGLVTGACLSDFGLKVTCVDRSEDKIEKLNQGVIPIYEPGLEYIVERNFYYKRLDFTLDIEKTVKDNDVIFIAVGTPPQGDGNADLQHVKYVAQQIGQSMNRYKVIVNKSTVPVGTGKLVEQIIKDELKKRKVDYGFDVVSNPEFLREGSAVHDFTHPDRVVIGTESNKARKIMREVYRVLNINEVPFVETNLETAELIKYASNAFLAMKITFINEMANLCENVGAKVQEVARAMGRDGRISSKFLHPGPGYGGSCFPKDTRALVEIGKKYNSPITLIETTIAANERQKNKMVEKIQNELNDLKGKTIGILGVAFKANTDDTRESSALTIMEQLANKGAKIKVYDPCAMEEAKWRLKEIEDKVEYCEDEYEAVNDCNALVIITEWNQFRNLDLSRIKESLKEPYFFDFRNIYSRDNIEKNGFIYIGVGQ
ncbi:UDP-glucose dehydrogenase family protein [Sporosalibacterium faouarense]|uniref:UDP-glucose dehydrogenase family protein n=1 Tax=Sporosalibacterium faouarense TaxID=516123 RepID=UPI00141D3148|nr:UDP-glucose/GDP-mannose dehydrogenase family protein [Sporosalibacterium faouarense]MTI46792.1 UDP-glucose/GDP-mannose dehydrogenase family protein [Bacillota bacterium]